MREKAICALVELSTNLVGFCIATLVMYLSSFAVYTKKGLWTNTGIGMTVWYLLTAIIVLVLSFGLRFYLKSTRLC